MAVTQASRINRDGMKILLNRFGKSVPDYNEISDFKIGNSTNVYTEDITDLPATIIPITGMETMDDCETADWTQSTDATAETLNSSSFKEGSNSLNLGKDGTASTTAAYEKTVTSLDGTSKDFSVWVYIETLADLASAAALTLRIGSDSSNYYEKVYANSSLVAGWNYFKIAIFGGFDSTTGSPVITALDFARIAFETTLSADTITLGDLRMDFWQFVSSDDYIKAIEATYPIIDETALSITYRGKLTTTEGNGFNVRQQAFFNDDSTRKIAVGSNFTAYSKTTDDLLVFENIIKPRNPTN